MFKNFLHGLARMFTVPRAVRNQLADNPLAPAIKTILADEMSVAVSSAVANRLTDPTQAAAVNAAIGHAIDMTGVFK